MSEIDDLREFLAGWARGDFRTGTRLFADNIRFSGAQPEGQVVAHGPDGIARFMRGFLEGWEHYTVDAPEPEDLGEGRYLATGKQYGKGRGSAVDVDAPVNVVIRMAGGKIVQLELYFDREDALAALAP